MFVQSSVWSGQHGRLRQAILYRIYKDSESTKTVRVDETSVDEIGVDETAVDKIGVDETAVDETGVDETGVDEPAIVHKKDGRKGLIVHGRTKPRTSRSVKVPVNLWHIPS